MTSYAIVNVILQWEVLGNLLAGNGKMQTNGSKISSCFGDVLFSSVLQHIWIFASSPTLQFCVFHFKYAN